MIKAKTRNAVLAAVGLLALTIYILACTSFSPDDRKVLYPTFDVPSGGIGMAVYDRETRSSEMLFLPVEYESRDTNVVTAPSILRGAWLANGRDVAVAYAEAGKGSGSHDTLNVALIPWGARKAVKVSFS